MQMANAMARSFLSSVDLVSTGAALVSRSARLSGASISISQGHEPFGARQSIRSVPESQYRSNLSQTLTGLRTCSGRPVR